MAATAIARSPSCCAGPAGCLLPVLQPKKIAQRHRIRTAPGDAALAGDPLEITDHVHAEVTPRRHRWGTHLPCVIGLARRLDKPVKTARHQHCLNPVVEHMAQTSICLTGQMALTGLNWRAVLSKLFQPCASSTRPAAGSQTA